MKKANLSNFWNFLTKQRKRQIYLLILLMIITSILEVMSLGAVLPFLGVLADPEKVFNHEITAIFNSFFNITRAEQLYIPFTLLFVSLAILSGFARIALLYVMTKFSFATGADFSIDIYRRTLYQSYSIHVGRNSSDVISGIVSKTGKVSGVILNVLTLVSSFFIVIGTISLLFAINVLIALSVMSFFSFFYILVVSYTRNKLKKNGEVISIHSTQVIKSLQEGLGGIRDIIIDGSQKFYCKLYRNSDLPLRKAAGNNVFISGSPRFIMETLAMVLIATLALMLSLNNEGLMSAIPMLGALALAAQRLLPIIQQAYAAYSSIIGSKASLVDIIELLNQPYPNNINKPQDVLSFNTNIKISNISFGYRDNEINVLNNVNIDIEKGDRVGFIGTTGSGKSTLVDIIMALLIPDSGFISVDNVRIDKKIPIVGNLIYPMYLKASSFLIQQLNKI